jgi:hypothetical protein
LIKTEEINNDREQIYKKKFLRAKNKIYFICQKLIAEMDTMKNHINKLTEKCNTMEKEKTQMVNINKNSNNTTTNNINNNVTNNFNIQLVGYSKENNQSLTNNEIFKLMCSSELVRLQLFE